MPVPKYDDFFPDLQLPQWQNIDTSQQTPDMSPFTALLKQRMGKSAVGAAGGLGGAAGDSGALAKSAGGMSPESL